MLPVLTYYAWSKTYLNLYILIEKTWSLLLFMTPVNQLVNVLKFYNKIKCSLYNFSTFKLNTCLVKQK